MDKQIYDGLIDWAVNHSDLNYYDRLYGEFLLDREVLIFPLPLLIFFDFSSSNYVFGRS